MGTVQTTRKGPAALLRNTLHRPKPKDTSLKTLSKTNGIVGWALERAQAGGRSAESVRMTGASFTGSTSTAHTTDCDAPLATPSNEDSGVKVSLRQERVREKSLDTAL